MEGKSIERLAYSVEDAAIASGLPRTRLYEAIGTGDLRSFKDGRRRLIRAEALRDFIATLEQRAGDHPADGALTVEAATKAVVRAHKTLAPDVAEISDMIRARKRERELLAYHLRSKGLTYAAIAKEMARVDGDGEISVGRAWQLVQGGERRVEWESARAEKIA